MKPFLTFILLGPFIGGAVLAACAFPLIATNGRVDTALSMSLLFILFSPAIGIIPAAITIAIIHLFKRERYGKALATFAAKIGFFTTFVLALLFICISKGIDADWATPASFDVTLLTDTVVLISMSAAFGLLGLVPSYICAKLGYGGGQPEACDTLSVVN